MDCSLPDSSVHGILQARILEWVVMPFSRGSFWPRDLTWVSCFAGRLFTIWATRKGSIFFLFHNKHCINRSFWLFKWCMCVYEIKLDVFLWLEKEHKHIYVSLSLSHTHTHTLYLICTPIPRSYNSHSEYCSWPWNIPSDSISKNMKGVSLRCVALGFDCQVVPPHYGWDGIHVLLRKILVASDFRKSWKGIG